MKRSALTLAILSAAGAAFTAQADTTLYGSARVSVDYFNPDVQENYADALGINQPSDSMQVVDNLSRVGVKGSEDLGGGLSAIYQYEFGVDITGGNAAGSQYFTGNRPRWAGLQGGFGTLTAGVQYTPYYNVIGYLDIFNSAWSFLYMLDSGPLAATGASDTQTSLGYVRGVAVTRRGTSVVYETPSFGGLKAQGMLVMDGDRDDFSENDSNYVDVWEANLTYTNGPFFAGGAIFRDERSNDLQGGAVLGYNNGTFGIGLGWQQYNPDDKTDGVYTCTGTGANASCSIDEFAREKLNEYTIQGTYTFGNNILRASYAFTDTGSIDADVHQVELGFEHTLSKRTLVWVEYYYTGYEAAQDLRDAVEAATGSNVDDEKSHVVSVGIRHDF